ncbi:MAG: helix-turn-helix domain-containing protein [Verrucomicrobiales bacterium]|nr:helix-turn-helix domain-containing protein [Verrucomicrobiales bacterium]
MNDAIPSPFPRRLLQARQMMGWSLRELSDQIGGAVSYAALAKYEHGKMEPSSGMLLALASALKQSPDFFFRPFRLQLTGIRFRKKSRLSVTAETAFREQACEYFERYQEIEELVGDIRTFTPPFPGESITVPEQAEEFARRLREQWKLGEDPLPNVQQLLEDHGIKVFELATDDRQFDGLKAGTEVGPVVVLASWLNSNVPRKRMTEVHELAHIVLPFAQGTPDRAEEPAVARFAGAFLLPEESFKPAFGAHRSQLGVGELIQLKVTFGVSIWAIMKRAEQLGLISPAVYQRFCIYANEHQWRTQGEPGDALYQRPEHHGRFRQLVFRAIAEDIISMAKGAELLGVDLVALRRELQEVVG